MRRATPWQQRLGALPATELAGGLRVHEALRFGQRRRGLAGVAALPPEVALRLHRCASVHTFGMRFALDLVWLDGRGRVVRVDRDVRPRRLRACRRARQVVETAAGAGHAFAEALASDGLTDSPSLHN